MTQISRDDSFYFHMIIFQVEGKLFKVPRKPFEDQSDVFKSMFTLPPGHNAEVDGLTDDKPIHLDNIKKNDFRAFLQVLFPPAYGEDVPLSETEWLAVLNLSNMWGFTRIRQAAIDKIHDRDIDLVTKIEIAHKFDIREWYYTSYLMLGKREEPLTVDEGLRLGFDFALKMAQVRERLLKDKIAHPAAYQRLRQQMPVSSASRASRTSTPPNRMPRTNWSPRLIPYAFPGEYEDEDDIVLAKAISDIFGIRGEPHGQAASSQIDERSNAQNWAIPLIYD